jgi:hypothetical protein
VLDLDDKAENAESMDIAPAETSTGPRQTPISRNRRRLLDMARAADALAGDHDTKPAGS